MAILRRKNESRSHLTVEEITALFGGKVIKRYKDKIVLAKPAFKPKYKKKPTPAQAEKRELMQAAVSVAKTINSDPTQKAQWKKHARGFTNVYQAVVSWYLKTAPKERDREFKLMEEQRLKRGSKRAGGR